MDNSQAWYILKRREGHCDILSNEPNKDEQSPDVIERWGPFDSQQEAIARRVGLIRAGKCKPV